MQFQLPEEMHENVVLISHIPELPLWPSQSSSQNLDKPSTKHLSENNATDRIKCLTRSPAKARGGRPYCPINLILTLSPSLIDF